MGSDVTARSGPSGPRASFLLRLLAMLIDGLILGVVDLLLVTLLSASDAAAQAIAVIVNLTYFVHFEGSPSGQTVGKRAVGIRVIDFGGAGAIGYGRAAVRWVGRLVSALAILIGYFWMLWDKERQTWHDKMANCVVVPVSDYPVAAWPG